VNAKPAAQSGPQRTGPALNRCPFCGHAPEIVRRDVEPQGDSWYGDKIARFVLCDCGAALFDGEFHEGFESDAKAAAA
jgi:hypothetical protein